MTDAVSQYFQGKIFASGRIAAHAPPCPAAFAQYNIFMSPDGPWHTKYFPGHALWLGLGFAVGLIRIAMPFGYAVAVMALARAARGLTDRATAHLAAFLMATSPLGLLLGASFMSHSSFLMYALAGAACLAAGASSSTRRFALHLLGGVLLGLAAITRPQDVPSALAAGAVLLLAGGASSARWIRAAVLPIALGAIPCIAILLAWNHALYGSFLASGYQFGAARSLSPIMNDSLGISASYPWPKAMQFAAWTILKFNKVLFGWPSSLLLLPLSMWGRRPDRVDVACWAGMFTTAAVYFFFPYAGFEYEARYYATALPFAAIVAARAFRQVSAAESRRPGRLAGASAAVLFVCLIHALVYYWPLYLWPRYAGEYEGAGPALHRAAQEAGLSAALVLYGDADPQDPRYSSGFIFNDPDLAGPVIYARNVAGTELDCLERSFPERAIYRAERMGDTFTFVKIRP